MITKGLKRLVFAICMLVPLAAQADITTTSQNFDDFSFKKGLKVNGGLSVGNTFYRGSDSIIHRDPYALNLSGNLGINLWGISMPFSFCYSNTHMSYTQPFNRYKLDPRYKWAHLLVGYNTLELSKYTLSDHDFRGVGVELTPEHWDIAAMYGRLLKAVEFDPLAQNYNSVAYRRMGYGAKVGYQAKFGGDYKITFFHGWDDDSSLKEIIPEECLLTPQKNTAVSFSVGQKLFKKFFIRAEYAFTVYNSNLMNGEGEVEEGRSVIERIMGKRSFDRYMDAINGAIGYQDKMWGISFNYERITPGYTTLGGYYFTNDVETFSLSPNFRLLKGKLSFSGNVGLQRNNLDDNKAQKTKNVVYSANLSIVPNEHWNASLAFSNYNTYTHIKPQAYPYYANSMDSLNFYQVSRSLSAALGYNWGTKDLKQSINATTAYQCARQLSQDSLTMFSDYVSGNLGFSQQIIPIYLSWSVYGMVNYCNATSLETRYYGPGANISKAFAKGKVNTSLGVAYNIDDATGREKGSLINTSFFASYAIDAKKKKLGSHLFSLTSGYTKRFRANTSEDNNYEFLTSLNYRISF